MKSDKTIIRKTLMEQFNFITNLLGIKDPNIIILDVLDAGTHKKIIALNIKKERTDLVLSRL